MPVAEVLNQVARIPAHVAIIMDGNGRWAKARHLPRVAGHRAGIKTVRAILEHAIKRNIKTLTLFAFSHENWQRPEYEVKALMSLFFSSLEKEQKALLDNDVRLCIKGDRSGLSDALQKKIAAVENLTQENQTITLNLAINYGAQQEIFTAAQQFAQEIVAKELAPDQCKMADFEQHLMFSDTPAPDLCIRTSGEQRISNFMLWQLAYAELFFTQVLWPEFSHEDFDEALLAYAQRERRFGTTSEQLLESSC